MVLNENKLGSHIFSGCFDREKFTKYIYIYIPMRLLTVGIIETIEHL